MIVDAATGKLLYRQNLEDNLARQPAVVAVRDRPAVQPMNAFPWNYPSTDTRAGHCWTADRRLHIRRRDDPATTCTRSASPRSSRGTSRTSRACRHAAEHGRQQRRRGAPVERRRPPVQQPGQLRARSARPAHTSAARDFPFTNQWYTSGCDPASATPTTNPNVDDWSAVGDQPLRRPQPLHDYAYYLGWDEGHWNAQQYNNGVTTLDPSPTPGGPTVPRRQRRTCSQDGAISGGPPATGPATTRTWARAPTGQHPSTNMFLWQPLPARSTPRASTARTT